MSLLKTDASPQNILSFDQLLLDRGLVSVNDLKKATLVQQRVGGHLGSIIVRLGIASEEVVLTTFADAMGFPWVQSDHFPQDLDSYLQWLKSVDLKPDWLVLQGVVAIPEFSKENRVLRVVMRLGQSFSPLEFIAKRFSSDSIASESITVMPGIARNEDLDNFLALLQEASQQGDGYAASDSEHHLRELAEEAPVIELVNSLFAQAADKGASDIHLDPQKKHILVRFRLDGVLYKQAGFAFSRFAAVVSRIKLLSNMDIAEKRLPQDGRIAIRAAGKAFDVRVSSLPGIDGETIVMRLLPVEQQALSLAALGMQEDHVALFSRLITKPHGIFLVTGPTGSGKTTTLYTALDLVNDGSRKIITVEDPVEYQMDNISQVQVNSDIDLTFAAALRTILRQDPDIIMLGEIRDLETAEISVQASLTGHLVFSTLHTNDSVGAFIRLIDMGVDPFLVATPVSGVMAQRLVRKLCTHCATPVTLDTDLHSSIIEVMQTLNIQTEAKLAQPSTEGCHHCSGTGYAGRAGIYELIVVSEEIREAIIRGDSTDAIWTIVLAEGGRKLKDDGLIKAWQGVTSIEEVMRVTAGS